MRAPGTPGFGPTHAPHATIGKAVQQPSVTGIKSTLHKLARMESVKTLLPKSVKHLKLDDVADYAMQALDTIGNLYHAQYLMLARVEADHTLDMPDGCEDIDYIVAADSVGLRIGAAATTLDEQVWMAEQPYRLMAADAPATGSADPHPELSVNLGSRWLSYPGQGHGAQWGKRLPVSLLNNSSGAQRLLLPPGTGLVLISYRSRIVDHRGWPLLTPKEALCCAYYCEFVISHDRYMAKELPKNIRDDAKAYYEELLGPARNEGLGDKTGLAQLLNNATSFHRHLYGSDPQLNQW